MMEGLVHATGVVIATRGVLLVGPPGAGKSSVALRLLEGARRRGRFAGLISDDQVALEECAGRLIASGPASIRGMIELRGAGIGHYRTIDFGVIDFVVEPINTTSANRIPDDNRQWTAPSGFRLPLISIDRTDLDPYATLESLFNAFAPKSRHGRPDHCLKSQIGA